MVVYDAPFNARLAASFERDLGRMAHVAEGHAKSMASAFGTVKSSLIALGGALSLETVGNLARELLSSASALDDMAEKTGASVESLSKLTDIARIYRVPPHLIADLSRSTNNNIEMQSLEFTIFTMLPWFVRWEMALSRDLLTADYSPAPPNGVWNIRP